MLDINTAGVITMSSSYGLNDLPTEVILNHILPYLTEKDVRLFGQMGSKRFKEIVDEFLFNHKCK